MGKRKKKPRCLPIPQIDRLYVRDGGHCWICGEWGPVITFNKDHLIPRSLGGSDGMWNLRISHPSCNAKRDRMPPPLDMVLLHCITPGMVHRAKRMYYRAYPHLKPNAIAASKAEPVIVKGVRIPKLRLASVTPGPAGHTRHPSLVCAHCNAWCGTCKACWCTAFENDHDVFKIRSPKVAMGVSSPS